MSEDGQTTLPRSLRVLWGREQPPRRGPKPGLSLERIAAAAISLADAEGLGAVSMSRVAGRLGFTTMALYRYVSTKDDLSALMLDVAVGRPALPAAEGWRAQLERWSRGYLSALRRHPWATRIPISGPPLTPNQVAWMEAALAALAGTGLTDTENLSILLLLSNYVRSVGQLSADLAAAERDRRSEQTSVMSHYGRMLAQVIDAEHFPTLCGMLARGVFDQPDDDPDEEFDFGLRTLLDGVALLVQARQATQKMPRQVLR
jgi:AcrR family transcriptional regulator